MLKIPAQDPRGAALVSAIRCGDVEGLRGQLDASPELATARLIDDRGVARTLLHVVADWPGHFANGAAVVAALVEAGAEVNAAVVHAAENDVAETPLHWAASSDDVAVLDALLDHGADIEAPGAVFTGGTPMSDAVVFGQWRAARRLLERGAGTTIWQAAALGLEDRVQEACASDPGPSPHEITNAFWHACRGDQRRVAELLLERGADPDWTGHGGKTSLDVAEESGVGLVQWLRELGAKGARAID